MKRIILILMLTIAIPIYSQGLFDEADDDVSTQELTYELNGYVRGAYFLGKVFDKERLETKSSYGESALKLKINKEDFGDAYAEIRYRNGDEFGKQISELNIREAYVNTYFGNFGLKIGKQIVVWGKADGFNPTNNITPQNMLVRSVDEDDKREGNFLIRTHYNFEPFDLEAIWIPVYRSSVLPIDLAPLPPNMSITPMVEPSTELSKSSFAVKLNLNMAAIDGSVSYFEGDNPMPGIDIKSIKFVNSMPFINIIPKAYRLRVLGADFSTTLFGLGLRGEFAYKYPFDDYKTNVYIPNPEFQYVVGLDKSIGDWNFIVQYMGKYVEDYFDLVKPTDSSFKMVNYLMNTQNRLFSQQLDEITHSLTLRASVSLFHETMTAEVAAMANLTTEEYIVKPKISYNITDAMNLYLGVEYYNGPQETLFGIVKDHLSSVFVEFKTSF